MTDDLDEVLRKAKAYDYLKKEADRYRNATLVLWVNRGGYIFCLKTNWFQFRWFAECENWFVYVHFGKRWFRFSNCGFIRG